MSDKAKYYMIGGFLGAGKTTAVAALAQHLTAERLRVGLITNDQGRELVDTAMLRARGFATAEIPGGCFCCRFQSLVDAAGSLTEEAKPDAFVAEPVGSCTDLMATVSYPLRRIYGDRFDIAPLSVLVDPVRAEQVFGWREGRAFSPKVIYIWRKQIEEADLVIVTKSDLVEPAAMGRIVERLSKDFPGKPVLPVSVKTGAGVNEWFDLLKRTAPRNAKAMEIDYDIYADGEALLGWLNATVRVAAEDELDAQSLLQALCGAIQQNLGDTQIAHLKMTFSPSESLAGEIAAISVVRNDLVPELTLRLDQPVTGGELIVNCRAEAAPEQLRAALNAALEGIRKDHPSAQLALEHSEQFRPGRPQPTHRMLSPEETLVCA